MVNHRGDYLASIALPDALPSEAVAKAYFSRVSQQPLFLFDIIRSDTATTVLTEATMSDVLFVVFIIVVLGTGLVLFAWPRQTFEAQSRAWNGHRWLKVLYTARERARALDVRVLRAVAVACLVLRLWSLYAALAR